jgi:hypothetical protein
MQKTECGRRDFHLAVNAVELEVRGVCLMCGEVTMLG